MFLFHSVDTRLIIQREISSVFTTFRYNFSKPNLVMKRLFLLLLIPLFLNCKKDRESPSANPAEDIPVSEFTLEDPFSSTNLVDNIKLVDLNDKPVNLKEFAGRKIFLNFWATWCKPCIMEMPSIERAQESLTSDGYVFFLASDESVGRINRFKATQDFQLNFIRLETPFPDIGILSLPTTLIIDEQGKIVLNQIGALEWDAPEVLDKLRSFNM